MFSLYCYCHYPRHNISNKDTFKKKTSSHMETMDKELFYLFRVFCAVVEEQSFTGAARKLQIQSPAVSKAIARLEKQLNKRLLNRSTRMLELTDVGRILHQQAQEQLLTLSNTLAQIAAFQSNPIGKLKVTATPSIGEYLAANCLAAFQEQHPEIQLELKLSNDIIALPSQQIDVALRSSEQLEDSQLTSRPIMTAKRILVASSDYQDKHVLPKKPSQLTEHQCLVFKHEHQLDTWSYKQHDVSHQVVINPSLLSNSYSVLKSMCQQGFGIARLFDYQITNEINTETLIPVLENYHWGEQTIHAIYHGKMKDSPKLAAFLTFLRDIQKGKAYV